MLDGLIKLQVIFGKLSAVIQKLFFVERFSIFTEDSKSVFEKIYFLKQKKLKNEVLGTR